MQEGYTYSDEISFEDKKKKKISIVDDTFAWEIRNGGGTLIHTATIGAGLVIIPSNKLQWTLGTPVTDTAGTYTHKLIWTVPATGEEFPVLEGTIIVDP